MSVQRTLTSFAGVLAMIGTMGVTNVASAGDPEHTAKAEHHDMSHVKRQEWSFGGLLGQYDKAQLRRGFTVYNEVCSACHSMKLLSYRNLAEPGGPEYSKDEIKAFIAEKEVFAGPNEEGDTHDDEGSPFMRKPILTDHFVSPYANDKKAMAANGGALPPDLSVMAKARGIPHAANGIAASNVFVAIYEGVKEYIGWIFGVGYDVATQYQEGGPDYIYALLTSYADEAPEGKDVGDKNFNHVFPGNAISMAAPLGTLETGPDADKEANAELLTKAKDVSAFLMWASEPHLNARKSLGLKVLIYLIILSGLMYAVKRSLWAGVKH